jgi:hypothetical protein
MLKNMDSRDVIGTAAGTGGPPAHGLRVHVSDASPCGFWGHVTAVYQGAVTVTRDSGARELVILSRRRVTGLG